MIIRSANFVCSSTSIAICPPASYPEYAFCGRSNVGKSSLINMLTGVKGLAKTSSTPGKTRLINHFLINEAWYLADLPGYGYARISKSAKAGWEQMITDFLLKRENLMCLFVLIDSRLEPQQIDKEFISYLAERGVPFVILFTKADKLTKNQLTSKIAFYKKELLKSWEELPTMFITSAELRTSREDVLRFIEETNALFEKQEKAESKL
jgi:GTP-binding protein